MFVYLDESGRLDSEDSINRPCIAGIILPDMSIADATIKLSNLKKELCPSNIPFEKYELKASKLLRAASGGWKVELAERFFTEYLPSIEGLRIVAVVCRRPSMLLPKDNYKLLHLHHIWLLHKVYEYLDQKSESDYATFVYDSQGERLNPQLSNAFTGFLLKHPKGKDFMKRITPVPLFGDSSLVPGIEIADMVAGCLARQADAYDNRNSEQPFLLSRYSRYKNIIETKCAEMFADSEQYAIQYASKDAMERVLNHAKGLSLTDEEIDIKPNEIEEYIE